MVDKIKEAYRLRILCRMIFYLSTLGSRTMTRLDWLFVFQISSSTGFAYVNSVLQKLFKCLPFRFPLLASALVLQFLLPVPFSVLGSNSLDSLAICFLLAKYV